VTPLSYPTAEDWGMGATSGDSFFSRPPKLAPPVAIMLGVICIPLGCVLGGGVGGGLVGGGIGSLLMGIWDFSRLRYVAWRRFRMAARVADSVERDTVPDRPRE
jgi:hypothetical protein